MSDLVGARAEIELTDIAHGGHAVGRVEGQVVFVRHGIPGERVLAEVTRGAEGDRFVFADAVEVLAASEHRVQPRCPVAGPGGCGGCDFQHVDLAHQRRLKGDVVAEQLRRLAGEHWSVEVEPMPGEVDGLSWRTRVEFAVDRRGRAGLRPHRSRDVIPLDDCPIATRAVVDTGVLDQRWRAYRAVDVVAPFGGQAVVVPVGQRPRRTGGGTGTSGRRDEGASEAQTVVEVVESQGWAGRFEVAARGFWQVHPSAPATFLDAVLSMLDPREGERVLDLYAGVGLFARAFADRVGSRGAVLAVESDETAASLLERVAPEQLEVRCGRVERELAPLREGGDVVDLVVLDPPRSGAGRAVVEAVCGLGPRAVAYVACDPAALARDVAIARECGYVLRAVRAFDAFPMTHHVETIAVWRPAEPADRAFLRQDRG